MVEGRIQPCTRAMALIAGLREIPGHMVRVGRALKVLQVAGHARRTGQVVIVVDMAIRA